MVVGDEVLRAEHRAHYTTEFPQPEATYLRYTIVAAFAINPCEA